MDIIEQKKTEQALIKSEEHFRILIENVPEPVFIQTQEKFAYLNCAAVKLFQADSQDQLVGHPVLERIHPKYHAIVSERMRMNNKERQAVAPLIEEKYIRMDGSAIEVEVSEFLIEFKELNGSLVFPRVITNRKRGDRGRLAAIVDSSDDAIIAKDLEGTIMSWNAGAERMFGYGAEEMIGRPITVLVPPNRLDEEKQILQSLRRGERVDHLETVRLRKDGLQVDVSVTSSPIKDAYGKVVGVSKIIRDVTDYKLVNEALRKSEIRYRRLFEAAKDGILILDAETGMVLDVNKYLIDMLGYTHEQFTGKAIWELGFLKDVIANQKNFIELQVNKYIRYENLALETVDGQHVDVEFVSNIYKEEEDKKVIQCNIRNITDRKMLDDKLKKSLKEKSLLLQELNHRVNNNLQLMLNLISLQRKNITDEKTVALFNETQSRIKSIALVHEKLYLTKGFSDINFSDYLKDLACSIFNSFTPPGCELIMKVEAENIQLETERSVACGLIINEILSNVFKYAFPGNKKGEIYVSFHRVGSGDIELVVKDNGVGIPERLDLRAVNSLGMKLIFNLVEKQLGGTITIDRSSGTLFKIIFKESLNEPS